MPTQSISSAGQGEARARRQTAGAGGGPLRGIAHHQHRHGVADAAELDPVLAAVDAQRVAVARGPVCRLRMSEPACGSVMAAVAIQSPVSSLGSQRAFCSAVPRAWMVRGGTISASTTGLAPSASSSRP